MIEVPPDVHHGPLHFLAFPRTGLPTEFVLVFVALGGNLLPIDFVLLLVPFLQLGIQVFPHVSDDPSYISHSIIWVFLLDALVDVHAIEEESAECLLGRLRRYCPIKVV